MAKEFNSINEYAKLCSLKNRNKNMINKNSDFKYMDVTGSYVALKREKKSDLTLCSCCKSALRKDIEIINRMKNGYGETDVIWYLGPLLPREIFKNLDFDLLLQFRRNKFIDIDRLFREIRFEDDICRLCEVKSGKYSKISFEEFNDLILAYKHQVINELNIYENFYFAGGCRQMSYSVLQYNQKFICDEDEYEVKISSEIKTIEEIKKVIPIMINFYDENMKINMDFYLNNEEVNKERKYFEDIDLVLKEKLGYGKSVGRWKKEEELYRLIKKIYSKYNVIYQYKPSFLYNSITKGQQSLDIYIEDLKIGIEYQGKQHYEAIEIFGGKKGLIETKKRDQEKLERCRQNGVKIIYIKYDEKITEKNIKDKISINNY